MKLESLHGLPCLTLHPSECLADFDLYIGDSRIEDGLQQFTELCSLDVQNDNSKVNEETHTAAKTAHPATLNSDASTTYSDDCAVSNLENERAEPALENHSESSTEQGVSAGDLAFYIRIPHSLRQQHADVYTIGVQSIRDPEINKRMDFSWNDRLPSSDHLFGNIDIVDDSEIKGWYRNVEHKSENTLCIYINGSEFTRIVCNQTRHDVARVFGDDFLYSGFSYAWPQNLDVKSIELRELGSEISVLDTPVSIHRKIYTYEENSCFKELVSFFDPEYYLAQFRGTEPENAFQHYLNTGWQQGLDPSEAFSTDFYLQRHDDIRKCGMNPLEHYALYGQDEGREILASSLVDKAYLFLIKCNNLSPYIARLIMRAQESDVEHTDSASFSLYEHLKNEWRVDKPRKYLTIDDQTNGDTSNAIYTADETIELLHAAEEIFANKKVMNDLRSLCRPSYYEKACNEISLRSPAALNMDTVSHFVAIGRHYRLSPSPLFCIDYYIRSLQKSTNNLSAVAPENALIHYLEVGEATGHRPCAFFNPSYYRTQVDTAQTNALVHFMTNSSEGAVQPSSVFWSEWYVTHHDIKTTNPLEHFYEEGIAEGLAPNPLLDLKWYKNINSLTSEKEALLHYTRHGFSNDQAPHPLIQPDHIRSQHSQTSHTDSYDEREVEYYFRLATKLDPHPLFSTAYYTKQLKTNRTITQPLHDYLHTPKHISKFPNPYFSDIAYFESRPDVAKSGQSALMHYHLLGYTEKSICVHPLVDHKFLVDCFKKSSKASPLEHILSGNAGVDFQLRPKPQKVETQNNSHWLPVVLDIDQASKSYTATSIEAASVGILAHVFYVNLLDEIITLAKNIPKPSVLLVSTDSSKKKKLIEEALQRSTLDHWEIRVFENRGRDIAPSFFGFLDRIENLDYAVHLHTKRSPHYGESFDKWREYLFAENGGSKERVEAILRTFESNPKLGALAPADFGPIRKLISWGKNRQMVKGLLQLVGDTRPLNQVSLELPSGSMFWFRVKALRLLFNSGLKSLHFDPENGQTDGTLAHAIERSFFYFIENEGYDWARFCTGNRHGGYKVTNDIRFARSRLLPNNPTSNAISIKIGETSPFHCRAVDNSRPRLNLLIPTADLNIGYAGISEAIRQYMAIGKSLQSEVDLRIITTDSPFNKMTIPPTGFVVTDSLIDDRDMIVVPGYLRKSEPLGLRPNDIFMASAWWNAQQAFNILEDQKDIFETPNNRRIIYLIQDFEPCFYPWSTRWAMAESTYQQPEKTIAVFNTPILSDFMSERYTFSESLAYHPMINEGLMTPPTEQRPTNERENIVLLYARPHAERNCLELIDAIVAKCIEMEPEFWADWKFLAIGEDFEKEALCCDRITVAGRLSINDYRGYLRNSKLGISLMVSPHPSYPPLEMAANGVKVLTNTYENKNLSNLHENISSFNKFDPIELAKQMKAMALSDSNQGKPLVDWFFNGENNLDDVANSVSDLLREDLGIQRIDLAA